MFRETFLYNILYGKNDNTIEKKPFYVQNKKDYLESLERNCKEMGIPFKTVCRRNATI